MIKSYYVFNVFEPWNWIVVASAPDQFVRFCHADARQLCLSVSDDGVGIAMARTPDRQKSSGLGSQIVSALAA